MKTLRQSIILPVFALIVFLGFGAGTALANSSNEGVGGWSSEAAGPGQVSIGAIGNLSGIDGTGDARFTSNATASEPKRRAFVGTLNIEDATSGLTGALTAPVSSITIDLQTSEGGSQVIGLPGDDPLTVNLAGLVAPDRGVACDICRFPGGPRKGSFVDGAEVVVLAEGDIAVWVLFKPVRPDVPSTGLVVGSNGNKVKIEKANGDTETVTLPEGADDVAPGEVITVFRGNSGQAKGLVRAADVKIRLEKFRDNAEADVDADGDEDGKGKNHDKAAAHAERIASFLARFNERQTRLIDRVIGRGASDGVKAKLLEVRDRIQGQRAEHQQAIDRIRAKLDRQHPVHSHRGGAQAFDDLRPDNSDRGRPEGAGQARPDNADQNQGGERPSADDGSGRGRGRGQGGNTDTPTP